MKLAYHPSTMDIATARPILEAAKLAHKQFGELLDLVGDETRIPEADAGRWFKYCNTYDILAFAIARVEEDTANNR
jgi:phage terminase small subunit